MIDEKNLIEKLQEWANNALPLESDIITDVIGVIEEQPKIGEWIPCSERLPEERDWHLAVFRESDTGFILIPRVAEYVGRETRITTKDYWIIIDLSTPVEYIRNLECIAWQPLPEPWKGE